DDRLAPAPAQSIRDQPRADIDTAARSERHDELDRPLRPGLCGRWLCRQDKHGEKGDGKCKTLHTQQWYLRCRDPRRREQPRESSAAHRASCITSNDERSHTCDHNAGGCRVELMFYAGAIWRPRSSKASKKRKRERCAMGSAFWTLDDCGKASKSGESK